MSTKRTPEQSGSKVPDRDPEGVSPTSSELQNPSSQRTDWVLHSLSSAHGKIDGVAKDVGDLKAQVARIEEKVALIPQILNKIDDLTKDINALRVEGARVAEQLKPIPKMDERLQAIERIRWIAYGVLGSIAVLASIFSIIRFILPFFNITISPSP